MSRLSQFGGKVGLKINIDKTKVLRYNPGRLDPLTIRERNVEDVESFVYLGAKVDKQGGAAGDIRARIGKARAAFNKPKYGKVASSVKRQRSLSLKPM